MGKRLLTTPRSKVRAAIRQLFLRSREHAACLKAAKNTCAACGAKKSVAKGREVKVECHHKDGIPKEAWERAITIILEEIIGPAEGMVVLCKECHLANHDPVFIHEIPGVKRNNITDKGD